MYGPSTGDNPDFFDRICEHIENTENEHVIIAGDWNCPLDAKLDTRNYNSTVNRPRTRKKIKDMMTEYNLSDMFREIYPDKRKYTWRKFNSIKQARLDYFLVSEELQTVVNDVEIDHSYRSDHSLIILDIKKENFRRDRPFWKFKTAYLEIKNIFLK